MLSSLNHEQMGRRNRAVILRAIQRMGSISRMELADAVTLSRPTVTRITGELLDLGIISEDLLPRPGRDEPRAKLSLNADWGCVVTVSMVFNLSVAVTNLRGDVLWSELVVKGLDATTFPRSGDTLEAALRNKIEAVLAAWRARNVIGIGAAVGGVVDEEGVVRSYPRLGLKDFDLAGVLSPVTDLPVTTDTETRLYLRSALLRPEFANLRHAVALAPNINGEPGSAAMLLDGRFYHGSAGLAGFVGLADQPVPPAAEAQRFRERVERLGGERRYVELIGQEDPEALSIYGGVIDLYGRHAALVCNLMNPKVLMLYTPYNGLGERFHRDIRRAMLAHLEPAHAENLTLALGEGRCDKFRLLAAATTSVTRFLEEGRLERRAVPAELASVAGA